MIYLEKDFLEIKFPELHENAGVRISFQRTLRLPDDGQVHHLPPGLGNFPLRHIEDFDLGKREELAQRGGVIMPMFQADALWVNFESLPTYSEISYPIAIKIGAGKICAVSGDDWSSSLNRDPQDYVVVPEQPWIDGYNVGKDRVRQFVAAPLGQGYTAEEQLKGTANVGGIQIQAFPMKKEFYKKLNDDFFGKPVFLQRASGLCSLQMGLAAGGSMYQEIHEDPYAFDAWDMRKTERCFVTISNAEQWMDITGEAPPITPHTAQEYTEAGLPWFHYFEEDKVAIEGAERLGKIKSIKNIKPAEGENFWGPDSPVLNPKVISLSKKDVGAGHW
jgi:hypothetical protein